MRKKSAYIFFSVLLFLFMMTFQSSAEESKPIRVLVDYDFVNLSLEPQMENGNTLVEFRPIFEKLGLSVNWDKETKTIVAEKEGLNIQLTIASKIAKVNNQEKGLMVAPVIINGHTVVPVRFIAENSGAEVQWDSKLRFVQIFTLNGQLYNAVTGSNVAYWQGNVEEYTESIQDIHDLLSKGADPNYIPYNETSLLQGNVTTGSPQVADMLLYAGADVDLKTNGITPLMQAVDYLRWDCADVLLKYKPDLSIKDDNGFTILERILDSDYTDMHEEYRTKFQFTMVLLENYVKRERLGKPYEDLIDKIKKKNYI